MNVRAATARVVERVFIKGENLNHALNQVMDTVPGRDQALLQELSFGTLRWLPYLQEIVDQLIRRPLKSRDYDIYALCLIGCYQLSFTRIPDHAALKETVDACRTLKKHWATKFVNGLLRQYQRRHEDLKANLSQHGELGHTEWFYRELKAAWPDHFLDILDASNQRPPMILRVNERHMSRDQYLDLLLRQDILAKPTHYSPCGVRLEKPQDVRSLPGWDEGWVSVQDEAAQFCATLLDPQAGERILDACAAPGGKTCHLLEHQPDIAHLDALDIDAERLTKVQENLERLQLTAQLIEGNAMLAESWWDGQHYDRILVDAPCTASGVIRRHPDSKILREIDDLEKMSKRQLNIIQSLWSCLKPGGTLLYATCSVFPHENERVIAEFVSKTDGAVHVPLETEFGNQREFGLQLFPREFGHDGFFYAKLTKSS